MTLRRRKKRPAPPPPVKDYNVEEPSGGGNSNKGDDSLSEGKENKPIRSKHFSHSLDSIPCHMNGGHHHDNNNDGSTLTLNSLGSFGGSNDDVFCDSVGGSNYMSHKHPSSVSVNSDICDNNNIVKSSPAPHIKDAMISRSDYVNVEIGGKLRTQSTSVVEDVVQWNVVPIDFSNQDEVNYVSTAEMARQKRGKGSSLPQETTDLGIYNSDPELLNIHKHFYKKRSKTWRPPPERSESYTPTSCYSSSESGNGNSPPKVRVASSGRHVHVTLILLFPGFIFNLCACLCVCRKILRLILVIILEL